MVPHHQRPQGEVPEALVTAVILWAMLEQWCSHHALTVPPACRAGVPGVSSNAAQSGCFRGLGFVPDTGATHTTIVVRIMCR